VHLETRRVEATVAAWHGVCRLLRTIRVAS
jgi:hypothetical protein